jgi:hypothetical protein
MNGGGRPGAEGPPPAGAPSAAGRRVIVIAVLGLALLVAVAVTYLYGEELVELAQSLLIGHAIHAQGHIRY